MYDLVIRNGRIVDGSGLPAYSADIAVNGDRIAVLGAPTAEKPHGHLQTIIDVPLARPRTIEQIGSQVFIDTKRQIESLIHHRPSAPMDNLPMIKLTQVGDDVV